MTTAARVCWVRTLLESEIRKKDITFLMPSRGNQLIVNASVQADNPAKIGRKNDLRIFDVNGIDFLANGRRDFLKKGVGDEFREIIEGQL